LGAVYRASLATGFHETTEGGLVDGHWVSVKKALASVDSSGYTLSFTPLITDSIEVKNINITPRHSSESVEQKYHLGRQHTARVSFSDVTRIRLDKDRFGNLMNVYLLGATGEPLDGLSATDWASKPIAGSKNLVAAIHTLCPNATEERGAGTALPLGAANTGAIGLPFTLPNDSAVRVANTGIMVLLRHMGYAAQSAEIYVVAGEPNGPEGIGPYRNDRATSDRNIAKFRSAHKSCDGSLMHIAGYEVFSLSTVDVRTYGWRQRPKSGKHLI
jgi:hypothetical protein